MYFLDSMFGWVGAALIGALPGIILSALVFIHREQLVDHRVKVRAAAAPGGAKPGLALFLQPALLLCLAYFALIAANTVGIQQFAVPAWSSMFGVTENYAAFCLIVFIVGSAARHPCRRLLRRPRAPARSRRIASACWRRPASRCRSPRRPCRRNSAAHSPRAGRGGGWHHQSVARHDRAQRHATGRVGQGVRLRLFGPRHRLVRGAAAVRLPDEQRPAGRDLLDRRRALHLQCRHGDADPAQQHANGS